MITISFKDYKFNIQKSSILLLVVSMSILTMPFFEGSDAERIFVSLLLTAICALEIYSDVKIPVFYRVQLAIGGISVAFAWMTKIGGFPQSLLFTEHLFFTFFFLLATMGTIYKVSTCLKLNNDTIFNAINGYLFLGLFGASMASVLELLNVTSFNFSTAMTSIHEFEKFIYYSFVTLTTVGYGDITPNSSAAKVLTIFLCTAGQLYLTVLVGLIVGKYISKLSMDARRS
jgi:voltage-gated potassium channel